MKVVKAHRGFEGRFYGEFMVPGGYRYGLFPDGDHTIRGKVGGGEGGLRTRSADAHRGTLLNTRKL